MSELKDHWEYENGPIVMRRKVYYKSDVDAVIAEKDRALEYGKALTLKDIEIIKEKDKEIAELKAKLEDLQATAYAESVDAGMRERRLKRALYKACAKWAMAESYSVLNDVLTSNRWVHTLRKLKAKLEEYK